MPQSKPRTKTEPDENTTAPAGEEKTEPTPASDTPDATEPKAQEPAAEAATEPAAAETKADAKPPAETAKEPPEKPTPDLAPAGLEQGEAVPETQAAVEIPDVPLAEYVVLNGPCSYGPVLINGELARCKKNVLYHVPDMAERIAILGTGIFRLATKKDEARAGKPSAGPGGAITREMMPPGALKGEANRQ